ncbi:hypothetical protein ABBQ32_001482 [Trebouxia sp. C0010 RCD-2024]
MQQCSGRSPGSDSLGMRWYLTEAPAAHLARSVSVKAKHRQSSAAIHNLSDSGSGRSHSQEGLSLPQNNGMRSRSWQPSSAITASWYSGTLLRVLLAFCLLCVYFVLLVIGY